MTQCARLRPVSIFRNVLYALLTVMAGVVVVGKTLRENLFGAGDPLDKIVHINSQLFEIIGTLAPKGQTATGQDQDDTFFLPYTSAQKKLRGKGMGVDPILT